MKRIATMIAVLAVATLGLVWSPAAAAQQITSGPVPITLNVTVPEVFSLACTPNAVSFTANGGTVQASAPISCTTTWNLSGNTRTQLTVVEYFTSNLVFGVSGANPSVFSASVDGGTSTPFGAGQTTFLGVTGYFGPTILNLAGGTILTGTHTDTIQLALNSGGLTSAGSLTATLNILAIAQ